MNKRILALAIPNIVTNIAIPLLGMVDMGLMGHLESSVYVGAVALGTTIFSFIFWSFGFLRMGTSGFTAQALGARNLRESMHTLYRALLVAFGSGLAIIALQLPLETAAFSLIKGSAEVEDLAREYFRIRVYAAPPTLCLYAFTGWFIGMQNARIPMVVSISVNVMNILFSLLFIQFAGMKSDGIALANIVSQYAGLLLAVIFFYRYYGKLLRYKLTGLRMQITADMRKFLKVNADIFIRTICLIVALSFFTLQSAKAGDTLLAVNSLLFQLFYFFSYFIDGFAYAAEALVGKSIGAGDGLQLRKTVRRLFRWGFFLSIPFTLLYFFGGAFILGLLTHHADVLNAAVPYLFWAGVVPLVSFSAFLWDGIYVGATASAAMRNAMIIITFVIFLPSYYLLEPLLGNHGLWLAMMIFLASRGILLGAMSKKAVFSLSL
ncbi:MAG TPA: MATE family efflux transporter [Bacteroidales bacterium]|nr:MATE family efflux transporter [Bacteroidales bacterium]HSA44873.1 MATE family efflux transporter [Bacteroidales bacterium]